jgi:ABC-type multidrug transport system ATPase subunit
VDEVMEELSISHIADSTIGTEMSRGISGGERRRLSIASELVTDPSILLLDEPTSGLDSYTAYALMETLKKLATHKKRTIIVSIHQVQLYIYSTINT